MKLLPRLISLRTSTLPLCARAIARTIASPSSAPPLLLERALSTR